jgi:hypothetical protein
MVVVTHASRLSGYAQVAEIGLLSGEDSMDEQRPVAHRIMVGAKPGDSGHLDCPGNAATDGPARFSEGLWDIPARAA